jgi:thiol-disulfide isomerase/thioredoxin
MTLKTEPRCFSERAGCILIPFGRPRRRVTEQHRSANMRMRTKSIVHALLVAGALILQPQSFAQEKFRNTLSDDPAKAWAEVEKVHQALRPPDDWREHPPTSEQVTEFQKQVRQTAVSFADKAQEFIERFPTNENVGDARITVVHALSHAVAAGDAAAERRIATFVSAVLADRSIPEDDRVGVLLYSGNTALMKKVGMRLFTEEMNKLGEEFDTASIESMRSALKEFPTNSLIYTMLVGVAQRSTGERQKDLATQIINAPGAPPGAKALATHILKGTKPYQLGKPVEIRFTALDGREVDLAKLMGKVVLVEFWSTTCGPCIAEMPTVKAVYGKLHDRGFEVVAISLDDKETALRRFVKEKELPWPQHFDGKGWENRFAVQYGIYGIPTMWLVDRQGNLRNTNAVFDLERRVIALLDSKPASTTDPRLAADTQTITNVIIKNGPIFRKAEAGELGANPTIPITVGTNSAQRHYLLTWDGAKWEVEPTNQ